MRRILRTILAMTFLPAVLPSPVRAEDTTVYVVTYIEVFPNALVTAETLLKSYRDASRKQAGCLHFDALQEISRPERFAMFEIWSDRAALDAHDETMSTVEFRKKLAVIQSAPPDERVNGGLYIGSIASEPGPGTVYVLTHVDLIPESNGQGLALLKIIRVASSQESGNLAYQVLQQANRPNHFSIVEVWGNMGALEAHAEAQHTREFRQALLPMEGSPYDDRHYRSLR